MAWFGFMTYTLAAILMLNIEFNYGTAALRRIDPDYYADPVLWPSILYLLRLLKHWPAAEKPKDADTDSEGKSTDIDSLI